MDKEIKLIKYAIEHLLDAELAPENGWSNEDINILRNLLKEDFKIIKNEI